MLKNMKNKVTGEQVKEAMIAANITVVDHHECGLCGYMTRYYRDRDFLYFDAGCNCAPHLPPLRLKDWGEAAQWINMQDKDEVRAKLAARFGLQLETENPVARPLYSAGQLLLSSFGGIKINYVIAEPDGGYTYNVSCDMSEKFITENTSIST